MSDLMQLRTALFAALATADAKDQSGGMSNLAVIASA